MQQLQDLPRSLEGIGRGDYVQQTMGVKRGTFRVPWYAFAPGEGIECKVNRKGVYKGTYFGPVHDIRDTRATKGFVSVCVPAPFVTPAQLVWINVFKLNPAEPADTWQSCRRVSTTEVLSWERQGWWHKRLEWPPHVEWVAARGAATGAPGAGARPAADDDPVANLTRVSNRLEV